MATTCAGLVVPRQSQTVIQIWLLLVSGLGLLSQRYGAGCGSQVGWGGTSGKHQGRAKCVSQVDGVSDRLLPATCWFCWSVGESSKKAQWLLPAFLFGQQLFPSSCPDDRHFSSSPYATGAFQAATPVVVELRRNASEQVWLRPFKRNC